MTSFLDPLLRSGAPPLVLTNDRNHRIVAEKLLAAFDSASRKRGLLKHDFLPEGSGLVIAPSSAIHTFFMRFAIDVAFVAKNGCVVKLRPNLVPCRVAAAWGAFAVIELPVGALDRADTRRGDTLRIASL
jgi:uncharacterized membrane protein (UPF0127 family)